MGQRKRERRKDCLFIIAAAAAHLCVFVNLMADLASMADVHGNAKWKLKLGICFPSQLFVVLGIDQKL